jgi:regulator of CtrA degradation
MLHANAGVRRTMSDKSTSAAGLVAFGEKLASSQTFSVFFREGMALVEETAAYLDGPGRQDAKKLERAAALAYATESMRLTTRLMQLASWLLLHRAVNEGEMSLAQANKEKKKVKIASGGLVDEATLRLLPSRLRDLILRSSRFQDKVRRLDANIHAPVADDTFASPVNNQIMQLRAAFERTNS